MKHILEQQQAIHSVLSADRKTTRLIPTWQDVEVLQSITASLGPLASLTDLLPGEKYVTISAALPLLHLIKNELLKQKDSDSTLTSDIKQGVLTSVSITLSPS